MLKSLKYSTWFDTVIGAARSAPLVMLNGRQVDQSSTKPESALGDPEVWETAERYMMEALNEFQEKTGHSWSLNPGDGAFYGPKIDVQVGDPSTGGAVTPPARTSR